MSHPQRMPASFDDDEDMTGTPQHSAQDQGMECSNNSHDASPSIVTDSEHELIHSPRSLSGGSTNMDVEDLNKSPSSSLITTGFPFHTPTPGNQAPSPPHDLYENHWDSNSQPVLLSPTQVPITTFESAPSSSLLLSPEDSQTGNDVKSSKDDRVVKRVAVSGPSRETANDLREKVRHYQERAKESTRKCRRTEKLNQTLTETIQGLREEHSSLEETTQRLQDDNRSLEERLASIQTTMEERIESFEQAILTHQSNWENASKKYEELSDAHKDSLVKLADLERRLEQSTEAQQRLEQEKAEVTESYRGELAAKDNEIMILRSTQTSNPRATQIATVGTSLRAERLSMLAGQPTPLKVVPYRVSKAAPTIQQNPVNCNSLPPTPTPSSPHASQSIPPQPNPSHTQDLKTVVAIAVKEALQALNIQSTSVESTARGAVRRRSAKNIICNLTKAQSNAWHARIREFWAEKYNRKGYNAWTDYKPAEEALVKACNDGYGMPNTIDLDFSASSANSLWNQRILENFAVELLARSEQNGWQIGEPTKSWVEKALRDALRRSREKWIQAQPHILGNGSRFETDVEATDRFNKEIEEHRTRSAARSRRQCKFNRRTEVVETVITLKTDDQAPDLEVWEYLADLLHRLTIDGMSSEEESVMELDGRVTPVFKVKICPWRATEISDYLAMVDKSALNRAVRERGTRILTRISTDQECSTVMCGLPRNMYNQDWLANIEQERPLYYQNTLCVLEEAFELLEIVADSLRLSA